MKRFFHLHNNVALKFQEIQYKFIDGIECLMNRYGGDSLMIEHGLNKLWMLKQSYESQLEEMADTPEQVTDIAVCFRCFDKKEGECHDCD